jgi:hypothetical protein
MRGTALSGTSVGVGRTMLILIPQPASAPPVAATPGIVSKTVS